MFEKFYYFFRKIFIKNKDNPSSGYWQEKIRRFSFSLIKNYSGNFLEIGCGEGLFLEKIKFKSNNQFGIDISMDQLYKARLRNKNVKLINADARFLPFKDNCFDLVLCINLFLNLKEKKDIYKIFKEIKRVSKKNCRLIFDIRNRDNPFIFLKYSLVKFYDKTIPQDGLKLYRLDEIKEFLNNLGIEILKIKGIGFSFFRTRPILLIEARVL